MRKIKILIMSLPGSGKTILAKKLRKKIKGVSLNADKIAINTAAIKKLNLIKLLTKEFGSQSIVVSIEPS